MGWCLNVDLDWAKDLCIRHILVVVRKNISESFGAILVAVGPHVVRRDLNPLFAVIDRKTVITGSFNWSPSAAHQNDEVLPVIRSPQVAAHFSREMDRLWRSADLGITERLRRKLERNRQRCGSGIERD